MNESREVRKRWAAVLSRSVSSTDAGTCCPRDNSSHLSMSLSPKCSSRSIRSTAVVIPQRHLAVADGAVGPDYGDRRRAAVNRALRLSDTIEHLKANMSGL